MRTEGITDRPMPPWQLPGAVRRDCEPHRCELLRWLVLATFLLSLAGSLLVVPVLLAVPLAVAVWVMARRDLAQMRLGLMDPAGGPTTRRAREAALAAALFPFVFWAGHAWQWLLNKALAAL